MKTVEYKGKKYFAVLDPIRNCGQSRIRCSFHDGDGCDFGRAGDYHPKELTCGRFVGDEGDSLVFIHESRAVELTTYILEHGNGSND